MSLRKSTWPSYCACTRGGAGLTGCNDVAGLSNCAFLPTALVCVLCLCARLGGGQVGRSTQTPKEWCWHHGWRPRHAVALRKTRGNARHKKHTHTPHRHSPPCTKKKVGETAETPHQKHLAAGLPRRALSSSLPSSTQERPPNLFETPNHAACRVALLFPHPPSLTPSHTYSSFWRGCARTPWWWLRGPVVRAPE